jgi:ParB/RepB/Spo0J family partition protein
MRTRKPSPPSDNGFSGDIYSELRVIPLGLIDEPELPAREAMDSEAMQDLKNSLRDIGLLSPIVVVERGSRYRVVAGHRRLLAARDLRWEQIRCLVYPEGWANDAAAMLHENTMREELNPAQEAVFFAELLDKRKLDEEGLCRLVKRSPAYVAERFKLLRGDEQVFAALRSGQISFAVARLLNRFTDPVWCRYYLDQAIRSGTSSRVVEQWLREWQGRPPVSFDTPAPAAAPTTASAPPPNSFACFLCGGSLDPYNLVTVQIHKWELAEVQKMIANAMEAAEVASPPERKPPPPA